MALNKLAKDHNVNEIFLGDAQYLVKMLSKIYKKKYSDYCSKYFKEMHWAKKFESEIGINNGENF